MAYVGVFGFTKALVKGGEANLPATKETIIEETTDIGKLLAAAVKRNVIVMVANLTMSFTADGVP
jgi:hypothetical protein